MNNFFMKTLFILFLLLSFCFSNQKKNENEDPKYELVEVAKSDQLWTGVAVSKNGRIFVNYPRWSPKISNSVCEIDSNRNPIPFPNEEWNSWDLKKPAEDYFICVQSVYIDKKNYLWILDAGLDVRSGIVENGPKLIKVDLQSNQVIQKIYFDNLSAPTRSYLNDIRVDTDTQYAYITDSGLGAIIVINLKTEEIRRTLTNHKSTKAENIVLEIEGQKWNRQIHSDGIALDSKCNYLYYQALTGYHLYRIHTKWLKDISITDKDIVNKVELYAKSGAADGIAFGNDGNLYLTSLELNAIRRITNARKVEMVIQDFQLKWPDSFSVTLNGDIYVTTSQLHLAGKHKEPFKIFRLTLTK